MGYMKEYVSADGQKLLVGIVARTINNKNAWTIELIYDFRSVQPVRFLSLSEVSQKALVEYVDKLTSV